MTLPPGTPPYQPGQPPSWQPPSWQPAYQAPAPAYPPPGVYPPAGQPGAPGPGSYHVPPLPRGRLTVGRVIGALALVWGVSFLVTVLLHWPIDDQLFPFVITGGEYDEFRGALVNWLEYTLPLAVGGGLASILLRPGAVRVVIGLGFAGLSAFVELVIVPAYFRHHGGIAVPALFYALSATALAAAWLVIRGRSAVRALLALVALPVVWLLQYLLQKAIIDSVTGDDHGLYDFLLRLHGTVLALAYYLLVAVGIALAGWLAAIGGSTRPAGGFGVPPPAFAGVPGPYPTPGSFPPAPPAHPGYPGGPTAQTGFPATPPAQPGYPAGPGYGSGQPGAAPGQLGPPFGG